MVIALATLGAGVVLDVEVSAQSRTIRQLQAQLDSASAQAEAQADWAAIARQVEVSVFTVETADDLGSGWVAHSDANGSDLITNFHVIESAWTSGVVVVDVRQGDHTMEGTIVHVDRNNDLAVIHVRARLSALKTARFRPVLAQPVMAVGSPLGLGGSVSVGVISGFRSLNGSDYIQFSAPISPGNSGGPVVDGHGYVVAIASAKFAGTGVEALSLGIPVQIACELPVACDPV